ncbi:hypothetical protein [Roseateles sp.]|jgi:hypothetical protein|uniref:hypothetical protein n=1 Tax=Roseateles sp. TaxID=1971397 RepID=UPI0037CA7D5D
MNADTLSKPLETSTLPQIALKDLPEQTKDYIIAYSATGLTVQQSIREILTAAAKAQLEGGAA